jgi:hypothetical protein
VVPASQSTALTKTGTSTKTPNYTINRGPQTPGTSGPFSKLFSGILKGTIGGPSLFLNPTSMGDSTLEGANRRAAERGEPIPFPDYDPHGFKAMFAELNAKEQPQEVTYTSELEDLFARNKRGELTPEQYQSELSRITGAAQQERRDIEGKVAQQKVDLAKQIQELATPTQDQLDVQDFMNERAQMTGEPATDVITPFQEQAKLTTELFTSPETAIGQFVPRATFTLPDGTIIQEDEGGTRRQITAEQLRQFEQDMASMGQPSAVIPFMGEADTRAALQERFGAPTISAIQALPQGQGLGMQVDPQGRMLTPGVDRSAYEQASAAMQARIAERDLRPGETQTERDTRIAQSRTQGATTGGLKMSDAVELAGGDRDLARTMVVRSRLGLDPMTGQERFKPEQVEIGGKQYIQFAPKYFQEVKEDTPRKTALQQAIEDFDADLAAGRLTPEKYAIAVENAKDAYIQAGKKPTPSSPVGSIISEEIAKGNTTRMNHPDGTQRDVPNDEVEKAKAAGYTVV